MWFDSWEFDGKALFFDKDGTLTDLRHQYTTLMEKRLDRLLALCPVDPAGVRKAVGLAVGYDEETKSLSGVGLLATATRAETLGATARVLRDRGMPLSGALALAQRAFAEADEQLCLTDLIRPVKGLLPVLSSFSRSGLILACLTNDERERTGRILRLLGVDSFFSLILGGDEVTRPKPDPEMFHRACDRLGVPPARVAYIGDSLVDLALARSGGAGAVVGVLGGACVREALQENADVVIPGLKSITCGTFGPGKEKS